MRPRASLGGWARLNLAILSWLSTHIGELEIAAITIDLTHAWEEVMEVAFHLFELSYLTALLATALLPALHLMAKFPGGHDVLDLNAAGAILIFARLIVARA